MTLCIRALLRCCVREHAGGDSGLLDRRDGNGDGAQDGPPEAQLSNVQ